MTFLVEDDAFHPHLRRGEFAVVDLADHQPAQGELFLMSFNSPRTKCGFAYQIVQMRGKQEFLGPRGWTKDRVDGAEAAMCWTACFWMPPEGREKYQRLLRAGMVGTCDGLYTTEYAAEKLVGRIVGVWVPTASGCRTS